MMLSRNYIQILNKLTFGKKIPLRKSSNNINNSNNKNNTLINKNNALPTAIDSKKIIYSITLDEENKFLREIVPLPPLENLVLKSGGVKGKAYIGALQEFDLKQIKRVAGASAGAITSYLIALGFSADEIQEISNNIPLSGFVNNVPKAGIKSMVLYNRIYKKIDDEKLDNGEKMLNTFRNIMTTKVSEFLTRYPQRLMDLKLDINRITFKNFKEIIKRCPEENLKEIFITGVKLSLDRDGNYQGEVEIFSTESPASENMEMALALRISSSIPYFYRAVNYNGSLYIDGACLEGFPIGIFDDPKYKPENIIKYRNSAGANLCTLGLRVDSKTLRENIMFKRKVIIEDQISWSNEAAGLVINKIIHTDQVGSIKKSVFYSYHKYSHNIIALDDHDVDTTDFSINEKKCDELIQDNKILAKNWFDLYRNDNVVMEDNIYPYSNNMDDAILQLCQKLSKSELREFINQLKNYAPGLIVDKDCKSLSDKYYDQFAFIAGKILIDKRDDSKVTRLLQELEMMRVEIMQGAKIRSKGLDACYIARDLFFVTNSKKYNNKLLLDQLLLVVDWVKLLEGKGMPEDELVNQAIAKLYSSMHNTRYDYLLTNLLNVFKLKKEFLHEGQLENVSSLSARNK